MAGSDGSDKHPQTPEHRGGLSHLDADGRAAMVDVSQKPVSTREAVAWGRVIMQPATLSALRAGRIEKGDVLAVSRVAGILAAKQTHALIPLCHPLGLDQVGVRFAYVEPADGRPFLLIEGRARTRASTGVEMEALVAVQIAALTIYDMLKAIDKELVISDVHLRAKTGGRSGDVLNDGLIAALPAAPDAWL